MEGCDSGPRLPAKRAFLAPLLVTLLAAAGCGGSTTAAPPLISQADAICKRLNAQLVPSASPRLSAAKLARSSLRHAALERGALAQLRKLTPPASLAADWKQGIAFRQMLVSELVGLAQATRSNDVKQAKALIASKARVRQKLFEIAKSDGFKDCTHVGPLPKRVPAAPSPGPSGKTSTAASHGGT
jgi:hypothetical protein